MANSRGIGAAIVERFAHDGANVTFSYAGAVDASNVLAAGTGAIAVRVDAADRTALIALLAGCAPLDLLVFNAGLAVHGDPLTPDPDAIDRMIDLNVRAPYSAAVEAARIMPEGDRVILIGSMNADRTPPCALRREHEAVEIVEPPACAAHLE